MFADPRRTTLQQVKKWCNNVKQIARAELKFSSVDDVDDQQAYVQLEFSVTLYEGPQFDWKLHCLKWISLSLVQVFGWF